LPSLASLGLHVCRRTSNDFDDFLLNLAAFNDSKVVAKISFDRFSYFWLQCKDF
jgi:hypothetical protein